jgi:hypothetical protein
MRSKAKTPPPPPKPFDLVVVQWEDAFSHASMQCSNPQEAIDAYTPCLRRTTGYFIGRTKAVVVVGTDDDRTAAYPQAIGGINYIPASLVRDIKVVGTTQLVIK